ncbi:MAG: nickel-dependent lactate racemase [Anaerolineae bacterium]|nr:nickel-dependent lactate racemase [Anaerolineae bacterium]
MPEFQVPYGKTFLPFTLPDSLHIEYLNPTPIPPLADPARAIADALDHPLGDFRFEDFARAQSVAIAINDKTRPVPLHLLLPPLLQKLARLGIPDAAITLIIGVGTHAPMPREEFGAVVPAEILARYRVISHDCDDASLNVYLGTTRRGTRVLCHREYANADLRIAIGDIEPHQFMGFSGGVKSAAVGVTARETIAHNHALMMEPNAYQGRYDDNPARQDCEEIGKIIGVHCALNSVIDEHKRIVGVFAGNPVAVMRAGVPLALDVYRVNVTAPFDVMIVSAGGHPKDINVYQAQKAVGHATPVMKRGGTIVWVAACPEGAGSKVYEEYVSQFSSHEEVLEHFKRAPFALGKHKAWQIARDATQVRLLMVTDLSPELARKLLLPRVESLDAALEIALRDLPRDARVGIMPVGNVTVPVLTTTDN